MLKLLIGLLGVALLLLALAGGSVYWLLRASLPRTRGERRLAGLTAAVTVERDRLGVPTVRGEEFLDVVRAQGFLHAQERFFQMDSSRRLAAGELAALVGAPALGVDRTYRPFRFRALAGQVLAQLPPFQRQLLEAYAEGANAGLADLGARPPEYLLLRQTPQAWLPEDSILILYAFHMGLSADRHAMEKFLGSMEDLLPAELFAFLTPSLTYFDTPLLFAEGPTGSDYQPLPIPGPEVVDLRPRPPWERPAPRLVGPAFLTPGSNNFAVAGTRTGHGGAILANDPHLELHLPNVWYHQALVWNGGRAQGASVPGVPGILIGASQQLAWGATVSLVDQADLVVIEVDPEDASRYLTPEGREPFVQHQEVLHVRHAPAETLTVTQTRWGPVIDHDWRGRPLALRSPALSAATVNLQVLEIVRATNLDQGLELLGGWLGPSINWLLADHTGRIGWVVNGYLPQRRGFSGKTPRSWRHGHIGWDGALDEAQRPRLVDPPSGVLFTANQRTVHRALADQLSSLWSLPYRAYRIQEMLAGQQTFTEADFLAMQLDTRSQPLDLIRDLVQQVVPADEADPRLARVRRHVAAWNGRADADQPGFRLLYAYYGELLEAVLGPLLAPVRAHDPAFVYSWYLADEPLRRLLETQPAHLLPSGWADWPAFLRATLLQTVESIEAAPSPAGLDAPWGAVHQTGLRHLLWGHAFPWLSRWVDRTGDPLPGWMQCVRAASPAYGASLRLAVSPGRQQTGLLHLPGGQSGHPLSPHYADGYPIWLEGRPHPFLPGPTHSSFQLVPPAR